MGSCCQGHVNLKPFSAAISLSPQLAAVTAVPGKVLGPSTVDDILHKVMQWY